jgi:trigger factor
MKTAIRPNAERETKLELLVNAIIDEEKIEATEEEINAYVEKISGAVGASADEIRRYFGEDYILSELKKEKVMDIIANSAVAVDPAPKAAAEETAAEPEKKETEEAAE